MSGTTITMPDWIKPRPLPWQYAGWISREGNLPTGHTFEQLVEGAKRSDHGEIREVDLYDEGAACWCKEQDA